jgi:cysteine desulfurase
MTLQAIYLDNSTTAKPSEQAISRMMPFLNTMWGIPSAPHQKGHELHLALSDSFKALYKLIGADEEDGMVFTSSGAEAVNHIIHSVYRDVTVATGKNQFLTSSLSEAPAIMAIERLEALGCVGKLIPVNQQGIITAEALADFISPRTALVSIPWGDGLTGVIQPIEEISSLCRQRGILLHLEATHILGKLFYDLAEVKADFITFNGDQLHAPKGTGGLYIRKGVKCTPLISGGSEQGGLRAGPLNIPGLVALACASKEALDNRDYMGTEVARLRDKLERGILKAVPGSRIFFQNVERLPHCTAISFPGMISEALLFMLNRKGVYACIGGGSFQQLGLILSACGIDAPSAAGALSFTLSRYTTESEIDHAIAVIEETAATMLNISKKIMEKQTSGIEK